MFDVSDRDLKFITLAMKMAQDIDLWAGVRISAILAYRGDLLSIGYNDHKTHPFQARFGKNRFAIFWHSETKCIANAIKRNYTELLPKSTMYVVRIMANGKSALARPCIGCDAALKSHNIGRILYSTNELVDDMPVMKEFIPT